MKQILNNVLLLIFAVNSLIFSQKIITVSKDGNHDFTSISQAFNAVPDNNKEEIKILVKNGLYFEKPVLKKTKNHVTLIGEDKYFTVIRFDDYKGRLYGSDTITTFNSFTTLIEADYFKAENITFENSSGQKGQAVALMLEGDKIIISNCRIVGNQDALYTAGTGRIYVKDSFIEGTTDFIFGSSVTIFDNCTIFSKKNSYITAASTPQGNKFGYVFRGCRLLAADSVNKVYLGRPWRPYAKTVFINCDMGAHIIPEGWHNWSKPEREQTTFYAEYGNTGAGYQPDKRVNWSKQLSEEESFQYTIENIFSMESNPLLFKDNWTP